MKKAAVTCHTPRIKRPGPPGSVRLRLRLKLRSPKFVRSAIKSYAEDLTVKCSGVQIDAEDGYEGA